MRVITVANMTELEGKNSLSSRYRPCSQNQSTATRTRHCKTGDLHARKLYNCRTRKLSWRSRQIRKVVNYRGSAPSIYLLLFFITNTNEYASFCLCFLYSGQSTVHAETPSSQICDKRFFHCGPYSRTLLGVQAVCATCMHN